MTYEPWEQTLREALMATDPTDAALAEADRDLVWQAVNGQLAADAFRALADRALAEPALAQAWSLALGIREEAALETQATSTATVLPFRAKRAPWALALAAAAILAVAIGLYRKQNLSETPAYRDDKGAAFTLDAATFSRKQPVLRWTFAPADQVQSYTVSVYRADYTSSLQEQTLTPEFQIPETFLSEHPAGTTLMWQVRAVLHSGAQIDSPTYLIKLD